jgi:hypothetical protein
MPTPFERDHGKAKEGEEEEKRRRIKAVIEWKSSFKVWLGETGSRPVSCCETINRLNRDQSSQTLTSLDTWGLQRVYYALKEKHRSP